MKFISFFSINGQQHARHVIKPSKSEALKFARIIKITILFRVAISDGQFKKNSTKNFVNFKKMFMTSPEKQMMILWNKINR